MNLWTIFLTGLFTGGLTCLALQGGLLATTIAERSTFAKASADKEEEKNVLPIVFFLGAKLVAYTILGFLLGWLGSVFQLSLGMKAIMQLVVTIFILGTAGNLLNLHPLFRYFVIQPPKFLTRLVRNQSKSKDFFAPALLGAFTVFIPCGTTQAMMALAIASGNPIFGATILFVFVLGTSPIFFLLGYFASKLGEALHQKFLKVAAFSIILLAIYNFYGATSLLGFDLSPQNFLREAYCTVSFCNVQASGSQTVSDTTINIENTGYNPSNLNIKAGSQVTLKLVNNGGRGCTQAFTIPKLGIQRIVPLGSSDTIAFTAPSQPGQISFMCSMGMYRGVINII